MGIKQINYIGDRCFSITKITGGWNKKHGPKCQNYNTTVYAKTMSKRFFMNDKK